MALALAGIALAANGLPTTAEIHKAAGIGCADCHGTGKPGDVSMDVCMDCHGTYDDLAAATAGLDMNPHKSHFGYPECTLCHVGHGPNQDLCATCHAPDTTADLHLEAGVGCSACHGDVDASERGEVSMDTCLGCHGPYEELAERTSGGKMNPHMSHYPYLDCSECHHAHEEDTDFCGQCH
jgi:fumarate reductase flavoprotein subunit